MTSLILLAVRDSIVRYYIPAAELVIAAVILWPAVRHELRARRQQNMPIESANTANFPITSFSQNYSGRTDSIDD